MSLLTICRAVAQDSGFGAPASIISNADDTATLLLALINKSGKVLRKRHWQALHKEYTFSTAIGDPDYALPSDYGHFIDDTAWNRDTFLQLRGSLSAQEWQQYKSGLSSLPSAHARFRLRGNLIIIDTTPTAVEDLVIEYLSANWVTDGAAFFPAFTVDDQTSLIDEFLLELDLTWRFLERKGLAYEEAKLEAETQIDLAVGNDVPANPINFSTGEVPWPPLPRAPLTGFGP